MTITNPARYRRRSVIAVAVVACLGLSPSVAQGGPRASAPPADVAAPVEKEDVGSPGAPTKEPKSLRATRRSATGTCVKPAGGRSECLMPVTAPPAKRTGAPAKTAEASVSAIPGYPSWCILPEMQGDRTEACSLMVFDRVLSEIRNGVWVVTGGSRVEVRQFAKTSTTTGVWKHWLEMVVRDRWGTGLNPATVTATPSQIGDCDPYGSWYFPPGLPGTGGSITGSAGFVTRVVRGAIGFCRTAWSWYYQTQGYPPTNTVSMAMTDIRCDHATAGTETVGCVVPWAPAEVFYDVDDLPTLALHVLTAQGSGLPGGPDGDPLTRTTNPIISGINRQRACGDAPSVPGLSCDEYPPASSRQGLFSGGTRRVTRGGCRFPNLPRDVTGPSGVSVCMVLAGENDFQGWLHMNFFKDWRVLDGDPWRVSVQA